jgi:hypothetical protein
VKGSTIFIGAKIIKHAQTDVRYLADIALFEGSDLNRPLFREAYNFAKFNSAEHRSWVNQVKAHINTIVQDKSVAIYDRVALETVTDASILSNAKKVHNVCESYAAHYGSVGQSGHEYAKTRKGTLNELTKRLGLSIDKRSGRLDDTAVFAAKSLVPLTEHLLSLEPTRQQEYSL